MHRIGRLLLAVGLSSCRRPAPTTVPASGSPNTASVATTKIVKTPTEELEAWLLAGCGPVETVSEPSKLAVLDPKLAKLAPAKSVFASSKGTIVHARGGELWLVSPDGRHRRRVKREGLPADDRPLASWSPTGDALAFVTRHGDERGRVVMLSASCQWARVLSPADYWTAPRFSTDGAWLLGAPSSKAIHLLSGSLLPEPPCSGRCVEEIGEDPWVHVRESAHAIDVARPAWKGIAFDRAWSLDLAPDARTLYGFVRFRGSSTVLVGGGKALVSTDFSPIFRVLLPATLPGGKTKPLVPEYFAPGFTSIREGWLSLSADGQHLVALGETLLPNQPRADAQWITTATAKTTLLGSQHKLTGARTWISEATWSPDSSRVLLTVAVCAGEQTETAPYCSDLRPELVVADEKHAAFLAPGSRASWTSTTLLPASPEP